MLYESQAEVLDEICQVLERRRIGQIRLSAYLEAMSDLPHEALEAVAMNIFRTKPLPEQMPAPWELRDMIRREAGLDSLAAEHEPLTRLSDSEFQAQIRPLVEKVFHAMNDVRPSSLSVGAWKKIQAVPPEARTQVLANYLAVREPKPRASQRTKHGIFPRDVKGLNGYFGHPSYQRRRLELVTCGFHWNGRHMWWERKGKTLSDEQIDSMMDEEWQGWIERHSAKQPA